MEGLSRWFAECGAAWRNPYGRQFFVAMVLWSLSVGVGDGIAPLLDGAMRVVAALAPLLPAAWAMWALVMYLRSVDELEQRKYIEALTFAFAATFLVAVVGARLETIGERLVEVRSLLAVMLLSAAVGYGIAAWRYR